MNHCPHRHPGMTAPPINWRVVYIAIAAAAIALGISYIATP